MSETRHVYSFSGAVRNYRYLRKMKTRRFGDPGGGVLLNWPSSFFGQIFVHGCHRVRRAFVKPRCTALSSSFDAPTPPTMHFNTIMITVDFLTLAVNVFCEHAIETNTDASYCSECMHMCVDLISRKYLSYI